MREADFLAYRDVQRLHSPGDWKFIRYPQINRSQLLNLKDDPAETRDLAADPASASKVQELIAQLEAEQRRLGDTLSLTSPQPSNSAVDAAFFQLGSGT